MKLKSTNTITAQEWDETVWGTYDRPYRFQQQDGCKDRCIHRISVPSEAEDYEAESVPEIVNHEEIGVSFAAWLARDPQAPLADGSTDYSLRLWWERNFYPDIQMIANDLHAKGILAAGDYVIDIDW